MWIGSQQALCSQAARERAAEMREMVHVLVWACVPDSHEVMSLKLG